MRTLPSLPAALQPLHCAHAATMRAEVAEAFDRAYEEAYETGLRRKLGLSESRLHTREGRGASLGAELVQLMRRTTAC